MKYKVVGGTKIVPSEVTVQGSKNSAMKHVLMPLLTDEPIVITNVPKISSIDNLKAIVEMAKSGEPMRISEELFFHTSAGWLLIPLLINKCGEVVIENKSGRMDTGGDAIGRKLDFSWYGQVGVGVEKGERFFKSSDKPFKYDAKGMFGPSVFVLFAALGKSGVSEIANICNWPEMEDVLAVLDKMGAKIERSENKLLIDGRTKLHGCTHENMDDRNDLVTWIAMALATESELTIKTRDIQKLQLEGLWRVLDRMAAKYEVEKTQVKVFMNRVVDLEPVDLVASYESGFTSEWQVLLAPVLAQISGKSHVVDTLQKDRMGHWEELGKMGARYKLISKQEVEIEGGVRLVGTKVVGRDVRGTAVLLIAGMVASGETIVIDKQDSLKRGYEGFARMFEA